MAADRVLGPAQGRPEVSIESRPQHGVIAFHGELASIEILRLRPSTSAARLDALKLPPEAMWVRVGVHEARDFSHAAVGRAEDGALTRTAQRREFHVEILGVALAVAFLIGGHARVEAGVASVDLLQHERLIVDDHAAFNVLGHELAL